MFPIHFKDIHEGFRFDVNRWLGIVVLLTKSKIKCFRGATVFYEAEPSSVIRLSTGGQFCYRAINNVFIIYQRFFISFKPKTLILEPNNLYLFIKNNSSVGC